MSLSLTLPSSRDFDKTGHDVTAPTLRHHDPARIDLSAILIKIGSLLAMAGGLGGVALYKLDMLTLFWIKLLPIPTCGGGALLCLGVLILCIRELGTSPDVMNLHARPGNSV